MIDSFRYKIISFLSTVAKICAKAKFLKLFRGLFVSCILSQNTHQSFAVEIVYSREELKQIISVAEAKYNIPPRLLLSIGVCESNLSPWVIGFSGKSIKNSSLEQSSAKIEELINLGKTNIDIGVMQINYHFHRNHFATAIDMLIPENNINYAAKLLSDLYKKHKNWQTAIRYYHSKTTAHNMPYSRKIVMEYLGMHNKKI